MTTTTTERYYITNRLGIPYEGMRRGEPVFNRLGYLRLTGATRVYVSLRRALAQRDVLDELGYTVHVRRIAPSGAITDLKGGAL